MRTEGWLAIASAVLLADGEETLTCDRQRGRIRRGRDRSLHIVRVIGPRGNGAGIVYSGRAVGEIIYETGIYLFVPNGLAVGDVVADIAECARLSGQAADRCAHGAEQGHLALSCKPCRGGALTGVPGEKQKACQWDVLVDSCLNREKLADTLFRNENNACRSAMSAGHYLPCGFADRA